MNAKKRYLTSELIQYLNKKASDPIWGMGVLAAFRKNWYSIIAVSPRNLIHFYGNEDTGWEHIQSRHSYYSEKMYFGKGATGDPSKFTSKSIPIYDFVNVADDIYMQGVVDEKEHPDAMLFVKYVGQSTRYTDSTGVPKDFVLILYRGTKIVHSLFPKKHLESGILKRNLPDLARGKNLIQGCWHPASHTFTVTLPYLNENGIVRYIIIIPVNLTEDSCIAHLQVNWPSGRPYYCIYKLMQLVNSITSQHVNANSIELTRFMNGLTIADFSHIEEVIERTEGRLFNSEEGS